ncbi:MAG: hypothetical protein AB8I08_15660 [Sandaracinaceae bacterium]
MIAVRRVSMSVGLLLAMGGLVACDPDPSVDAGSDAAVDANVGPEDAGSDSGPPDTGPPDAGPECSGPPGLYIDGSCDILAPGVRAYETRFPLWADQADKERYIFLPPGSEILTIDPDNWIYPVGTTIWKTFLLDGVRLETRVLEKTDNDTGPGAWDMRAYAWNEDQDEVRDVTADTATNMALRENVLGTPHDIPSGSQCVECHRASQDVVNGFSAIQLNHELGGVMLSTLLDEGRLSEPPTLAEADVPGEGTIQDALGYMHANCGHCHRYTRYDEPPPGDDCTDADDRCGVCSHSACNTGLRVRVRVQDATPEETDAFVTALGRRGAFIEGDALCRIHPGSPDTSTMLLRMSRRGEIAQMPPIQTEEVHEEGLTLMRAFVGLVSADSTACLPE